MSANLQQIYIANPITTNQANDLMYFMRSPYTPGNDCGMKYEDFEVQFSSDNWTLLTDAVTITNLEVNNGYTVDSTTLRTLPLPVTSAVGDWIEITGLSASGWSLTYTTGQSIIASPSVSTITTGSISSVNRYDCIKIRCVVANTTWTVVSQQSTGLTII